MEQLVPSSTSKVRRKGKKCKVRFNLNDDGKDVRDMEMDASNKNTGNGEEGMGKDNYGNVSEDTAYDLGETCEEREVVDTSNVFVQVSTGNALDPTALLSLPVEIENKQFQAIIDSGADCGMISLQVLKSTGLKFKTESNDIKGVGATNLIKTLGKVTLAVKIHGIWFEPVLFYVMPEAKHDVILGGNFCIKNHLKIELAREKITRLYEDGTTVSIYLNNNNEPCRVVLDQMPCFTTSQQVVKSEYDILKSNVSQPSLLEQIEVCSTCSTHRTQEFFFQGSELRGGDVQSLSGLMTKENSNYVLVRRNLKNKPLKIEKNFHVGDLTTMMDTNDFKSGFPVCTFHLEQKGEGDSSTEWALEQVESLVDLNHLKLEQKDKVMNMIRSVGGIFSKGEFDMGKSKMSPHKI